MNADRERTAGFTLLEMTIVFVVLALAAGLAFARGPMRSQALEVRSTAAQLAGFLRLARAEAIAQDRPLGIEVDTTRHLWRDSGGRSHAIPPGMNVAIDAPKGAKPPAAIAFYPDGSAAGGAITIAEGARSVTILVDWLTGRVITGPS